MIKRSVSGEERVLKIGVAGVGYLGQHHARIYSELAAEPGDLILSAVIDTNIRRAEEIASKYGCSAYADIESALDHVDALSIATPTTFHHDAALKCIRSGKDILIEKPITATVAEADEIISLAQTAGLIVQIGHLERFNPALSAASEILDSPQFFESERIGPFVGRGIDVDISLDLMIHDIDIVLSLLKSSGCSIGIKDIKAFGTKLITENIDMCRAWIEFECGAEASFTASRISMGRARRMRVYQPSSYIDLDYQTMELVQSLEEAGQIVHKPLAVAKSEPLREELRHFIHCVKNRSTPLVTAADGRDALKIAFEISNIIKGKA